MAEAAKQAPAVIATGGGAFLSARSRRALGERGLICWLDATPGEIARRLRQDPNPSERPLLGEDLEGRLQELDDERRVHYSHADLWVPAQGLSAEEVATRILRAWAGGASALAGGSRRLERLGREPPAVGPAAIVDTGEERYPIWVGAGELARLPDRLRQLGLEGTVYLVVDEAVMQAHGQRLVDALDASGYRGASYVVPPGESSKRLRVAEEIYRWLAESRAERRDVVVALGGGVVGDLAGYVAATYLRGMPFVQVPTSVLAMNDARDRRQGRRRPAGRQEPGRRVPPAARRDLGRGAVAHAATARLHRGPRRGREALADPGPAVAGRARAQRRASDRRRARRGAADPRDRPFLAAQGADRLVRPDRARAARDPQLRPHDRSRPGGGDRLPGLPPRRGGRGRE